MELLQLKYFVKVAETEHMSQAAGALFISQSSLSHTIQRLEAELGVQLFDRNGRNICLNEYGRHYLKHVKQALWELDEGTKELKRLKSDQIKPITVLTTIPDILNDLPGLFQNKDTPYPVRQQFIQRDQIVRLIASGNAEFAISEFPYNSYELKGERLFEDELYLIIGCQHPLATQDAVDLCELAGEYAFLPPDGVGIRVIVNELFRIHGITLNILSDEMTTTITRQALRHAAAGNGVIYITKYALYRFLQSGPESWSVWRDQVKVLHIHNQGCRWDIGLTIRKDQKLSDGAALLYNCIQEAFQSVAQDMDERIHSFFLQQSASAS